MLPVLDATTGRNGIVVSVQRELGIPVKLFGLGEGPDDLAPFEPRALTEGLVGSADQDPAERATRAVVEGSAPPHTGTAVCSFMYDDNRILTLHGHLCRSERP